jgi:predicted nucleic acid-binding Zn ribbon protein
VKTLVCPHCHTQVPENASVCTGCGAEIVRGVSRRQRSLVGLVFVFVAIVIFAVFLHAFEIAYGHPFLRSPKAEDGFLFLVGLIAIVIVPYILGTRIARLFWRSRIRFYRCYRHQ